MAKKIKICFFAFMIFIGIDAMLNGEEYEKRIMGELFTITKGIGGELKLTLKGTHRGEEGINERKHIVGRHYSNEKKCELLVDDNSWNYIFRVENYKTGEILYCNDIDRKLFENSVAEIYVPSSHEYFYSLECDWNTKIIILNRRTLHGEILESKTLNTHLDLFKSIGYTHAMIINENSNLLIISTNYEDVFIYSLKENQLCFQDRGRILLDISQETNCLYYANKNELFYVDYNMSMNKGIIKTFVNQKEEIVDFVKVHDDYVLVTSKKVISLWNLLLAELILGSYEFDHFYYHCDIEGSILRKKFLILKERKGYNRW